jgi:hypothetical protein
MAVTGVYMAMRVRDSPLPYVRDFVGYILHDVIPTFNDLGARADKKASDEFQRLCSQPAYHDSYVDMDALAEAAQDTGVAFHQRMFALRQTVLNLFSLGLFHLLEQQVAGLCHDGAFIVDPPEGGLRSELPDWYSKQFGLDLRSLSSWSLINELRVVANVTKHAEGSAARELRALRPALFIPSCFSEPHPELVQFTRPMSSPLAGDDLYVTPEILQEYGEAAVRFLSEIEVHFQEHRDDYYPLGDSGSFGVLRRT